MFSAFLVEDDKPCIPTKCDLQFTSIGSICLGKASIRFETSRQPLHNTVLYVPSLLYHTSGVRCKLRVTKCQLQLLQDSHLVSSEDLHLTKANWHETDKQTCQLPYSHVKSNLENIVMNYGAAQSPNDLLLYIGDIASDHMLILLLEVILDITPTIVSITDTTALDWYFISMLPANKTSLKVSMSIPNGTCVHSVTPLHDSVVIEHHISETETSINALHQGIMHDESPGFLLRLSTQSTYPIITQCHTILMTNPINLQLQGKEQEVVCDGIQMASCMFTKVPSGPVSFVPGEFIFMVDCSGSMSGQKIQSAAESLLLAIKSLPCQCYFNVIAFGSKYRVRFQTSMEASDKNIELGIQFINKLQACLGGTELLTPLRWVLKKQPCNGLPRHLFLITDGGVPNVQVVLQTATRHRLMTRIHTFAWGPEICSELMAGLANETGGQYKVIREEDRLQTKVMEVFHSCLTPYLRDVSMILSPPPDFTTTTIFPSFVPPLLYPGSTQTSYSALKKKSQVPQSSSNMSALVSSATCSGYIVEDDGRTQEIKHTVSCLAEESLMTSDRIVAILQSSAWAKMAALEFQLIQSRFQKPHDLDGPPTKKPRVNGTTAHQLEQCNYGLRDELVSISLMSGVPYFPYTHYYTPNEGSKVCQILPWNGPKRVDKGEEQDDILLVNVPIRKRPRSKDPSFDDSSTSSVFSSLSFSLSSLAKKTASSINNVVKTAVNVATLGLVNMDDDSATIETGERIEDQDYYQNKTSRIHWNSHHELILPDFYYISRSNTSSNSSQEQSNEATSSSHLSSQAPRDKISLLPPDYSVVAEHLDQSNQFDKVYSNGYVDNNEVEETCSSSSDNNQLLSARFDLHTNYIPLLQMQLPSGAWPLLPSLAVAIGVPIKIISELPISNGHSSHLSVNGLHSGHFWATALALAFLDTHFPQLRTEWHLMAHKGRQWLAGKTECVPISFSDIDSKAIQLVSQCMYHQC